MLSLFSGGAVGNDIKFSSKFDIMTGSNQMEGLKLFFGACIGCNTDLLGLICKKLHIGLLHM